MKKLLRDYKNNPLKYGEKPYKEDLQYLYNELNLTISQIVPILNITRHKIGYYIKIMGLRKTNEEIQESRRQLWATSSDEYKKQRSENIKKTFANWTEEQHIAFRQKIQSNMDRETPEQRQKRIDNFKKTWYNRTEEQQKERSEKLSKAYSLRTEEQHQQRLEKFRKTYSKVWNEKPQEEKDDAIRKMQETKKKKGLLNTSKQEDNMFSTLQDIFGTVERQYKSEEYPFYCDFYIPEYDTYVEANFSWTHGEHLFNPNSSEDIDILNKWKEKAKTSKFFENAIETWTVRDVEKMKYIEKNNLNFAIFYSYKEFLDWIDENTVAEININLTNF